MRGKVLVARKGVGFHGPRFTPRMFGFARRVGPAYNRLIEGIGKIHVSDMIPLFRAMGDFQSGRTRLIILFRHAAKADGPVVLQTVVNELPAWCRKTGNALQSRPHAHFLYGKDVLNWAGALPRWVFPGIGGIPVVNGRVEKESNSSIRRILLDGDFPLAFAPEGQVTYHSFRVSEMSQGTSKLAAWTHTDLRRSGRGTNVVVLPVAIGYRYAADLPRLLEEILAMLGGETGIEVGDDPRSALLAITEYLINTLEHAYELSYPHIVDFPAEHDTQQRIHRLCDRILRCLESAIGFSSEGSVLDRVFRTRYWIMDALHREDIDPADLTPAARSMADHRAKIAAQLDTHQQIVDVLEYVDLAYIPAGCGTTRLVEYGLNLLDICNRMRGGNIDSRFMPRSIEPHVLFGDSIGASELFDSAGSARRVVARLEHTIRASFEELTGRLERLVEPE